MLLRPEAFRVAPFRDATPLLEDPDGLRQRAEADGYLYFPGLVASTVTEPALACARAIGERLDWFQPAAGDRAGLVEAQPGAHQSGRGFDDPGFVALQREMNNSPELRTLGGTAAVGRILEALYEEAPALARTNILWVKLPGSPEHTTGPHQDIYYVPQCPDLWTVWFPLVDTPMDVGPLAVIPGSHRGPLRPHDSALTAIVPPPRTDPWHSSAVTVGDVVLFHARTVHLAWSNIHPRRVRISADVRYLRASSPQVL